MLPCPSQRWGGRRAPPSGGSPRTAGAHTLFSDFDAEAVAERARLQLRATGEHAQKRAVVTLDEPTAQEMQVARLAAAGETNREIAARLFISASTVEYHLRKAFRKLDVTSPTRRSALPSPGPRST
jgi:DNA-binding NarL/FixJ family response regulator